MRKNKNLVKEEEGLVSQATVKCFVVTLLVQIFDDILITVIVTCSSYDDSFSALTETFWEVISVPESKAYRYVDTKGEQFVRYTRYKLCRIYPAGYRIDSSNPNPQAFWNCGCQLGKNIYIKFSIISFVCLLVFLLLFFSDSFTEKDEAPNTFAEFKRKSVVMFSLSRLYN